MKKATHALGALLCVFSFSCGFDDVETLHQDLPDFYALDLSPGCFVPRRDESTPAVSSGNSGSGPTSLVFATIEALLRLNEYSLAPLQGLSQIVEHTWEDRTWEYVWTYGIPTFYPASEEEISQSFDSRSLPQPHGGKKTEETYTKLSAERFSDAEERAFVLQIRHIGTKCMWTQEPDAQSVCAEHILESYVQFHENGIELSNWWHRGDNIRWTRHTLSVENGEDGSTSVVGCDPKTGLSFVRWTRESLSDEKSNKKPTSTADCDVETGESVMNFVDGFCACWDAGGHETSCRGVNLWPTD